MKDLHAKIGELAVANDFLARKLKPWTDRLGRSDVRISKDGKGRVLDNIVIERLWKSLKYERVYLHAWETGPMPKRVSENGWSSTITSARIQLLAANHLPGNGTAGAKSSLDYHRSCLTNGEKIKWRLVYAALVKQECEFLSAWTKAALMATKRRGTKLGGLRDKIIKRNMDVQANAVERVWIVSGIALPM